MPEGAVPHRRERPFHFPDGSFIQNLRLLTYDPGWNMGNKTQ